MCYYFDIKVMGTKYKGSQQEVRALNAFITLTRSADAVWDFAHRHLQDHRLTTSQFAALEALYHCGELCLGDLAGKLMRTEGSITSVIDGLERKKLVRREKSADDKRFVNVRLTEEGGRLMDRLMPQHVKLITRRFSVITPEQQELLRDICRQLGKAYG